MNTSPVFVVIALLVLSSTGPAARASDLPPIAADRPGFTNGSDVVAPGRIQVEIGYSSTTQPFAGGGGRVEDYPEALVRAGVAPGMEIRVSLPDYFMPGSTQPGGTGDAAIGIKWKFYQNKSGGTKMAVTPMLTLPSHDRQYSTGHADPSLVLGIQTQSGARWSLASNMTVADPTLDGMRIETISLSSAASYQITDVLGAFAEVYDSLPKTGDSTPIADGGVTLLESNNVQLDVEAGIGLGASAPVRFVGGGVSCRF